MWPEWRREEVSQKTGAHSLSADELPEVVPVKNLNLGGPKFRMQLTLMPLNLEIREISGPVPLTEFTKLNFQYTDLIDPFSGDQVNFQIFLPVVFSLIEKAPYLIFKNSRSVQGK